MNESLVARLETLYEEKEQINREISEHETSIRICNDQLGPIVDKINELNNKQTEYTNLKNSLEALKSDLNTLSSSINEVITDLNNLGEGERINGITTKLGQRAMTVSKIVEAINSINASIDAKLNSIKTELKSKQEQEKYLRSEIKRHEDIISELEERLNNIIREIWALEAIL